MFWNKKKQALIEVTFHDGPSGSTSTKPFGQASVPIEQLPESFAVSTQMHVEGSDWEVLQADPVHRRDFESTGRLDLYLTRIEMMDPGEIGFTQLDITDEIGRPAALTNDDWIETTPLSGSAGPEGLRGLPPAEANDDEVHAAAVELSAIREQVGVEGDGVYCPTCHIANVDYGRLREPCPRCGRGLLAFGWT